MGSGRGRARRVSSTVSGTPHPLFLNQTLMRCRDVPELRHCYQVMVDLDSTIFPILEAMAAQPDGSRIKPEDIPTWLSLSDLVDGGVPRMLEIFDEVMAPEVMAQFPPFPGAVPALETLRTHGCEIHVKTDRPSQFAASARHYLDLFRVPYDSLDCAPGMDKLALCEAEDIAIVVDDHPDFLSRAHEAGLDALSLRYPYLDEVQAKHSVKTADAWPELAEHVADAVEHRLSAALSGK